MRLRNRLALVLFGIIIFLVATPILVLYARGFKIDWKNRSFIKTGAIVVKTEPTKAQIFLNDQLLDIVTPGNLRFLIPGDYNLRVEKDGYQSWTKRLSVKSQLVTWANFNRDFLALFYSQAHQVEDWQINAASVSKAGDEIITLMSDQVALININNGESTTLVRTNNLKLPLPATTELKWSNATQIFNLFASRSKWNLTDAQIAKISHLEVDSGHIIFMMDNNLYSFESDSPTLIAESISNFTLSGNDGIWYIQKNNLVHYSFNGNSQVISELPASKQSKIIRTDNQIYVIMDNNLYVVNETLEKIYGPVTDTSWDSDSKQLVYYNNNEIYIYNPATKDSTLIARSITQIQNPTLNAETGYVFYQNEGKIKAIELDGRDHRNIFTIADAQSSFAVAKNGKKLFTIGTSEIKAYEIR